MQNISNISENNSVSKKTWVKPVYEIVSKDVIKTGGAPGEEETTQPASHQS